MPVISSLIAIILSVVTIFLSFGVDAKPPTELKSFDIATARIFMLEIENAQNGKINAIRAGKVEYVGDVIRPAKFAQRASDTLWAYHYNRGQNGAYGCVVGTAVDTIDIRCGPDRNYDPLKPHNWLTSILSIIPFTKEDEATPKDIVVSCPGGSDIFNRWSPFVGNAVYAMENDIWIPISKYFSSPTRNAPAKILIDVRIPTQWYPYIEFENWVAGDTIKGQEMDQDGGVWVKQPDGERKQIAKVVQRVESTGMFPGSEYAEVGQVRMNTPGAIEISTNRWKGKIDDPAERGGFEIIGENDAKFLQFNLGFSWYIGHDRPYMVIAPMSANSTDLANKEYTDDNGLTMPPTIGLPPFFSGFIRPHFEYENFETSYRVFISEDFGRTWRAIPEITGVPGEGETSPVKYWTNIRLMLGR